MKRFFGILYDAVLVLVLVLGLAIFIPKIIWRKKLFILRQKLSADPPDAQGRSTIWIHAVSVGEVKSAKGLFEKIKADYPSAFLLVTTATSTGLEEAKRSLSKADAIRFMPLDFSWLIRKWVCALNPQLLLFIESDFWFNLLQAVKEVGGKTALVSAKLSSLSAARFAKIPFFAKKLFFLFDLILAQNSEHQNRFAPFVSKEKLEIGGNLKFDASPLPVEKAYYVPFFREISFGIALVSTHAPEEAELLEALQTIDATLFLAPRHPERFREVQLLLASKNISYCRWSQIDERSGKERVFLIDSMGQLPLFFSFCNLAIVGGSFSSRIGGHNVLEPCLYGAPVFFGPHMHQQTELKERVLEAGAGRQVELATIASEIRAYLLDPLPMRKNAQALFENSGSSLQKTGEQIRLLLKNSSLNG